MGLGKAKQQTKKREKRPSVTIEVSGEPCRFREPRTSDLQIPGAVAEMLDRDFADIPASRRFDIALIASCYLPDADEQGVTPAKLIAEIARDDDYVYVELSDKFFSAYPEFVNWVKAKADAKNDSRQEKETPSTTASDS